MRRTSLMTVAAAASAAMATAAAADTFNDLGAFLAAVPDATLVNFDTLPGGGAAVPGEIGLQYASVGLDFPPGNLITSGFGGPVSPPNGWLNNTFVGSDPTFDVNITEAGVRAVGVHNVLFASPNGAILRAFDSSGAELESVTSDTSPTTLDFFGVTTDADIARVTISVTLAGGWGLDDLYVGGGGGGGTGVDIRIDFGTSGGTPGNWNNIGDVGGLTTGLIDFNTGASTGASIDGNQSGWRPFVGDTGGAFPNRDWLIQPATADGAGIDIGVTGVYTVDGLTGSSYRVELVSARTTFDYLNTFRVQGESANRTFLGTPVETPWGSTTHGLTPGNWLIWDGVVPNGGQIEIQDIAGPGTLGILNAMRILEEEGGVECYADCDESGALDFFDFLCFQSEFAAGTAYADCDESGGHDFFDFLCFQNAFAEGCP